MRPATIVITFLLLAACAPPPAPEQPGAGVGGEQEEPSCICIALYDPVCGSDGKTYSNSCYAGCAGVTFKPGEC